MIIQVDLVLGLFGELRHAKEIATKFYKQYQV